MGISSRSWSKTPIPRCSLWSPTSSSSSLRRKSEQAAGDAGGDLGMQLQVLEVPQGCPWISPWSHDPSGTLRETVVISAGREDQLPVQSAEGLGCCDPAGD
ncbi:hypothetical protein NDU88_011701 [Pleurodeles waltl]|uniref:Uncharacterized protein n=1 Tax=Pleurodeles waltl TaxID=8319 RepID=A0AAV7Q1G9_PLEWA|nr:hypothetical protein NDU88_011701 [Pleurodeles waltl]